MDITSVKQFERIMNAHPKGKIYKPHFGGLYYRTPDQLRFSMSVLLLGKLKSKGMIILEMEDKENRRDVYALVEQTVNQESNE